MTSHPLSRSRLRSAHIATITLLVLALGVLAHPALSQIPSSTLHTLPAFIPLVGHDGAGNADPAGEVQVIVRDIGGNRLPGIPVRFDLSRCTDLRIAAVQPFPGLTVDCSGRVVSAISDAEGIARFRIVGGALNPSGAPGASFLAAMVWVGGENVSPVGKTVCAFDQNGLNGVDANDLSAWLADYGAGLLVGRSDYDGSGALGPNDLSRWILLYFGGGSSQGAGSLPGGTCP